MTEDAEIEESERGNSALKFALSFIKDFDKELQKGHSKDWARIYAKSIEGEFVALNTAIYC